MKRPTSIAQSGLASVSATLSLLLVLSLAVFYLNRHVLFEQRTAVNQVRALKAQALAQAGLDWTMLRLNDPQPLGSACTDGTVLSVREAVWPAQGTATRWHAACRWDDAQSPRCVCAVGDAPSAWPGATFAQQGFVITVQAHADDIQAVQLRAAGCIHSETPCAGADARAQLQSIAKVLPLLRRQPVAAVVAGGSVQACGPATLVNVDVNTPGWWAHAGASVSAGCGAGSTPPTLQSVAGSAPSHHAGDGLLRTRAADADTFIATWLGTSLQAYRAVACRVEGATPGARGSELRRRHAQGCRRFIVDDSIEFDADVQLGRADDPVALVLMAGVAFRGTPRVFGWIYADAPPGAAVHWAQLQWQGAVVARGDLIFSTAVQGRFDGALLARLALRQGVAVSVPGSWSDE
jgi:hypothetical protein